MMKYFRPWTVAVLLILCSCNGHRIDETYASAVVKHDLSIPGDVTAEKIHGGYSGASLFLAKSGDKTYVVKFFQGHSEREIYNSQVASNAGYGPKVYYANPSEGVMIMEFLSGKITFQDTQSDRLYIALAHLLQKIHQGPAFKGGSKVVQFITTQIQKKKSNFPPMVQIEQALTTILEALRPHLSLAPCHNDLWRGNLMFIGNECKAIDYGDAGQGDPYYDVACVVNNIAFLDPLREELLFSTYLGHKPSAAEKAKLYLMKQVVWMKWICNDVARLSPEHLAQYDSVESISPPALFKSDFEGRFDLSDPMNRLISVKARLTLLLENTSSEEFANALQLLRDPTSTTSPKSL